MPAAAAPPSCKSIAKGKLDVELPANQRSSRMVRLTAGDTLSFLVSGSGDTLVTLVSGPDAPQKVVGPDTGRMADFSAKSTETYVFAIEAGTQGQAAVSVNCTRAGSAASSATTAPEMGFAVASIDAKGDGLASALSVGFAEMANMANGPAAPINLWIGEAQAAVFYDTAEEHPEDGGAIALSLGANAEVRPTDLPDIFARLGRCEEERVGESEVEVAMAQSAILADFSFEATPIETASIKPRDGAKPAKGNVEQPPVTTATAETWVTAIDNSNGTNADVATTVAVSRPAAMSSELPPPMALGGALPIDNVHSGTPAADAPTQ